MGDKTPSAGDPLKRDWIARGLYAACYGDQGGDGTRYSPSKLRYARMAAYVEGLIKRERDKASREYREALHRCLATMQQADRALEAKWADTPRWNAAIEEARALLRDGAGE